MKRIFFIILLCLISSTCIAYDGSPEDQVKQFFHDLLAGKSNEAIDNLYSTNPAIQQKIQHITVMKQQVGMTATLYGKSIEVEDFVVEKITPSITRIVKVVKHEVHPVVWEFYFYKSHNKWVASQSLYNDQFKFLHKK